jgi:hypothetical protein
VTLDRHSRGADFKRFDHPDVGRLELDYETLYRPDDNERLLVVYSARPGSPTEEKLRLLAGVKGR